MGARYLPKLDRVAMGARRLCVAGVAAVLIGLVSAMRRSEHATS